MSLAQLEGHSPRRASMGISTSFEASLMRGQQRSMRTSSARRRSISQRGKGMSRSSDISSAGGQRYVTAPSRKRLAAGMVRFFAFYTTPANSRARVWK